ncbi:MAG: porin family protein [Mucilaginibacter sp.]
MKKLITVLAVPFIFSLANGQNVAVGVRAGISIPNLTAGSGNKNPLNNGYGSRLGLDGAVFAAFKFSDVFSLRPMIEYSAQGGKKNGLQAFTTPDELKGMFPAGQAPDYLYANYKSEARLNYLLLPVLGTAGWIIRNTRLRFYVSAGPFVGLLISAHQVTNGRSEFFTDPGGRQALPGGAQSFDNDSNVRNSLHRVNGGIEGNLGLTCPYGRNNFFIEGGGNYGFFNIQKNAVDGKNNTGAAIVTLGYNYHLK